MLTPGDTLVSEAGAMAWMDPSVDCKTSARGGVGASLKRRVLGGESFFQNSYTTSTGGTIALVAGPPGEIRSLEMSGQQIYLERGGYLASGPDVKLDSKFQGLKGLFAEGMFVLQVSGDGPLFFNSYGDICEVQVDGEYIVDNGYAVAWDSTLTYSIKNTATGVSSFLFGNRLVMKLKGQGRVWTQSRAPQALSSWIYPFRRMKKKKKR